MKLSIVSLTIQTETQSLLVRQWARQIAACLELDDRTQLQIAAIALEITQTLLQQQGQAQVEFFLKTTRSHNFLVVKLHAPLHATGVSIADLFPASFLQTAQRCMDRFSIIPYTNSTTIQFSKILLQEDLAQLKANIAHLQSSLETTSLLQTIQQQNRELLQLLAQTPTTDDPVADSPVPEPLLPPSPFFGQAYPPSYPLCASVADQCQTDQEHQEHQECEIRLRSLIEQAVDALFLHDFQGKLIDVNQSACKSLGYSREELLQLSVQDFEQNFVPGAVWPTLSAGITKKINGIHRRKDGSKFPVEVQLGLVESEGEPLILASVRDISDRQQVEAALREANAEMQAFFSAMDDLVFVLDRDGRHLKILSANSQLLYNPSEDRIGKTQDEIFPAETAEMFLHYIRKCLKQQETINVEYKLEINHQEVWSNASISPIDADRVIWVARNITDRKEMEQVLAEEIRVRARAERDLQLTNTALQESEARFQAFMNNNPAISFIHDQAGQLIYVNPAGEKFLGMQLSELQGSSSFGLLPIPIAKRVKKYHRHILETGEMAEFTETIPDTCGHLRDWLIFQFPISAKAKTPFIGGIAIEITERNRAEAKLRNSEQRYATLAQIAPVGIFRTDAEGYCSYVNDRWCQLTGLTPEESMGIGWTQNLHPEDRDRILQLWNEAAQNDLPFVAEYRFQLPDDTITWVFGQSISEKDTDGNILGYIGTITDITELKQAGEIVQRLNQSLYHRAIQLKAANKELEAFSYSVSHDLRAPLRSINGFSHILLSEFANQLPGSAQDYLHRIRAATQKMYDLIDDMLMLSRISRSEMNLQPVNLSKIAQEIATELQENVGDRQVQFYITEELIALGDRRLLQIALENLLRNAWKFTNKTTSACIEFGVTNLKTLTQPLAESSTIDSAPVYYVRDNGAGFNMNYVEKLFTPFQRLHDQTEFEGTGIGLAIVHRTIHRHGGQIWAEAAIDQGATFYFTIAADLIPGIS